MDVSVPLFFQARPEFYDGYLLSAGWGVLFTFFVGIPMLVLGLRPGSHSAAAVAGAAAASVAFAAIASGQPAQLLIAAAVGLPAAASYWASRENSAASGISVLSLHPPTLVLAAAALPVALIYGMDTIQAAREGRLPFIDTWNFDHWPIQAAAAFVIPPATALLAFRLPGWRAMVRAAALAASNLRR